MGSASFAMTFFSSAGAAAAAGASSVFAVSSTGFDSAAAGVSEAAGACVVSAGLSSAAGAAAGTDSTGFASSDIAVMNGKRWSGKDSNKGKRASAAGLVTAYYKGCKGASLVTRKRLRGRKAAALSMR